MRSPRATPLRPRKICCAIGKAIAISVAALSLGSVAHSASLVYEGFNGYGISFVNGTTKPNSNTIGLDTSAFYSGMGGTASTVSVSASAAILPPRVAR